MAIDRRLEQFLDIRSILRAVFQLIFQGRVMLEGQAAAIASIRSRRLIEHFGVVERLQAVATVQKSPVRGRVVI